MANDQYEVVIVNKKPVESGCAGILLLGVVLIFGMMLMCTKEKRAKESLDGVLTENFIVIWVREDNDAVNQQLNEACKNCYNPKQTLASIEDRKFYKVNKKVEGEFTQPKFVQSVLNYDKQFLTSPVYAVFKGSNSCDKFRKWLKTNGYSESDFKITSEFGHETNQVRPTKGKSQISFSAYYEVNGRLYLWDGASIRDLSEGITSSANGMEKENRDLVRLLTKVGE